MNSSQPQQYSNNRIPAEDLYEELNIGLQEEYLGLQLDASVAALIYNRDPIVRRVTNTYGFLMSRAPWQVLSSDSKLASYCRDAISKLDLPNWLGKATVRASIFSESFLILSPDWEQSPKILGIFDFESKLRREYPPEGSFLLRITAEASLARFLKYFYPYLQVTNELHLLATVCETVWVKDSDLATDLKRLEPGEQALLLQQRVDAVKSGFYNRGVVLTSGNAEIELLHRKVDSVIKALEALTDRMIAGAVLPYSAVLGTPKLGAGLSSLDRRDAQSIAEQVDSRRIQNWSVVTNWIINRLLLRIGADPGSAVISWESSLTLEATDNSEVAERESRTLKNYVEMGSVSPEEVRNSKFKGSKLSFGQLNLENEEDNPYSTNFLTDAISGSEELIEKLWEEYRGIVNMSGLEYLSWLRNPEHNQITIDSQWFPSTLKLLSANYKQFKYSKELQDHALRSLSAIARFNTAKPGKISGSYSYQPKFINLKNWGVNKLKNKEIKSPNPVQHQDSAAATN